MFRFAIIIKISLNDLMNFLALVLSNKFHKLLVVLLEG